jgi:hypothetical protein
MKYIYSFLILLVICFISLIVSYGYDEGTMRNALIGEFFNMILFIFKFPIVYLLPSKHFIFGLFIDVVIYSLIIMGFLRIIEVINKP